MIFDQRALHGRLKDYLNNNEKSPNINSFIRCEDNADDPEGRYDDAQQENGRAHNTKVHGRVHIVVVKVGEPLTRHDEDLDHFAWWIDPIGAETPA
jgi:hypothetical protein